MGKSWRDSRSWHDPEELAEEEYRKSKRKKREFQEPREDDKEKS